jgi:hypothetical protein
MRLVDDQLCIAHKRERIRDFEITRSGVTASSMLHALYCDKQLFLPPRAQRVTDTYHARRDGAGAVRCSTMAGTVVHQGVGGLVME